MAQQRTGPANDTREGNVKENVAEERTCKLHQEVVREGSYEERTCTLHEGGVLW